MFSEPYRSTHVAEPGTTVPSPNPLLVVAGASKAFGTALAVDHAHLEVRPGQLHALLGGNGSGKSTMIKMLAGVYPFDDGMITVRGRSTPARAWSTRHAFDQGLRFVHQDLALFPAASVADNICLGPGWTTTGPQVRWGALWRKAAAALDQLAPGISPRSAVGTLSAARQSMVAIARALVSLPADEPAVILLDEPTAALPAADVAALFGVLRTLTGLGHAVLYVTHRLDEVTGTADAVTVFRDGLTVGTADKASATESLLLQMIVGRPLGSVFPSAPAVPADAVALDVSHLSVGGLRDVSFSAGKGEIMGIASLAGSGGRELLQAIYGAIPRSGSVRLDGAPASARTPQEAVSAGMGFVPADRIRDAIYPALTVEENLTSSFLRPLWRRGFYQPARIRQFATPVLDKHKVKRASLSTGITALSGGNQQKVVMARCLEKKPRLLLLDEPTQGVDVATRAEIWASVQGLAASGAVVLVYSSDYEELVKVTDRILIVQDGHPSRMVISKDLDRHALTEIVYRQPQDPAKDNAVEERIGNGH